ncbi:uncharacterized protein LOC144710635 [Wolffia australiana]
MGKSKKQKPSIRVAIQEALNSFLPAVGAPLCMQPSKTHSFREAFSSFNSVYDAPPGNSQKLSFEGGEDEAMSTCAVATNRSASSSCLSSSSSAAAAHDLLMDTFQQEEARFSVALSSERFFFSPLASKSLLGVSPLRGYCDEMEVENPSLTEAKEIRARNEEDEDFLANSGDADLDKLSEKKNSWDLSDCSVPMAMESCDPYSDFRTSMEEMVMAYGLKDWAALEELLRCYIQLNERNTHKFILHAFVDILSNRWLSHSESESPCISFSPRKR